MESPIGHEAREVIEPLGDGDLDCAGRMECE